MNTTVITKNYTEGFHCYPEALGDISFLSDRHRHIFHIECGFLVSNLNREVEIFTKQKEIENYIKSRYGYPAEFKQMSCEMIAIELYVQFNCVYVKVSEDGEGGAVVQ